MLRTCTEHGEEIAVCFNGYEHDTCPLCAAEALIEDKDDQIGNLLNTIEELEMEEEEFDEREY